MIRTLFRHLSVIGFGVAIFFIQGPRLFQHPAERLGDRWDAVLDGQWPELAKALKEGA